MTPYEQAQRYIANIPGAVSGQGGHSQTYSVAVSLAYGFDLGEDDAFALLSEYNQRCSPPWSERELRHKLREAVAKPHDKPRGHLCSRSSKPAMSYAPVPRPMAPAVPQQPARRQYALNPETRLPDPLPDGARALIRVAFQEGEGVRICPAVLNEDGHEVPEHGGICLSREKWLTKLDAKNGLPNGPGGVFWTSAARQPGIYVTVNPMKVGGDRDADVTGFRHCLVEFDTISKAEQFNLYEQSRLPCTAIISSGGKSVHAWVKVDAKDRREYDERVKAIYQHFEAYGLDAKNKNPSRFSRLPNCVRLDGRQELLALNTGCESFSEWMEWLSDEVLQEADDPLDLIQLDTNKDPNCVIGFRDGETLRYLCKGKSAWLIGPSGVGKSSLMTEFLVGWSLGEPVFGIKPVKPVKSLVIQAENDRYDLAEMVQGISFAHNFNHKACPFGQETEYLRWEKFRSNVRFVTETTAIGEHFIRKMRRHIDKHKPDIVWIDPLLSYAGIDVAKQDQCSAFLRGLLNKTLESTGVVMIGIHHTGKPKGGKETANWTAIDHAYAGIGSSELVNWARAVMVLRPVDDFRFELKLAKRGKRAGATHPNGEWAFGSVWLQHAKKGIRWEQIAPPEELPEQQQKNKADKPKNPNIFEKIIAKGVNTFLEGSPKEGESQREIAKRLFIWCNKNNIDTKEETLRKWVKFFVETDGNPYFQKPPFRKDDDGKYLIK